MKRFSLIGVILFSLLNSLIAQSDSSSPYSIGLAFGRQKVGLPFHEMLDFPPHSNYYAEIARHYGQNGSSSWYQTLGLNLFQNTSSGSGYFIQSHIGRDLWINKSILFCPEIGIALSHRFRPKNILELSDGNYASAKDFGLIRPTMNGKLLVGYQTQLALIYASYQINAEFFYNEDSPVFPSNFLQLGFRYHLKSANK